MKVSIEKIGNEYIMRDEFDMMGHQSFLTYNEALNAFLDKFKDSTIKITTFYVVKERV